MGKHDFRKRPYWKTKACLYCGEEMTAKNLMAFCPKATKQKEENKDVSS